MAKSRVTTNPMYVGGAGGYSFYVRGGEQVIRQRKNNSNYGAGASRTMAQMIRRIRWGNLVNVFKGQKSWQPKAYDSKTKGQTDYNIFMALNINRATVGLTKEMCESGCAVIESYQVSRGSLPPIALSASGSGSYYVTDIKTTITIGSSTTVGQLAADIIANNPQFKEGDNIAFISFNNWLAPRVEWPYAASSYSEITLESSSTVLLSAVPVVGGRLSKDTNGNLQVSFSSSGSYDTSREVGFVAIHTRKTASILEVSSQEILMNPNSLVPTFSGAAWDATCINTYGLTDEVPLDPSFPDASISSVTANGSAIVNAQVLTGTQEVYVNGPGIGDSDVRLLFNGIEFEPLVTTDDSLYYIIGYNGIAQVFSGGRLIMSFSIQGADVPGGFPTSLRMLQTNSSAASVPVDRQVNVMSLDEGLFLNYPHEVDNSNPYFNLTLGIADLDEEDFDLVNCEKVQFANLTNTSSLTVRVTDADSIAYIEYDGMVVAVFNYS